MKYFRPLLVLALSFCLFACSTSSAYDKAHDRNIENEVTTSFDLNFDGYEYTLKQALDDWNASGEAATIFKFVFHDNVDPSALFSSWDRLPYDDDVTNLFARCREVGSEDQDIKIGCWKHVEETNKGSCAFNSRVAIYDPDANILWYCSVNA